MSEDFVAGLRNDKEFMSNVRAWHTFDAQSAVGSPFPEGLAPPLLEALKKRGYTELWSHQVDVWNAAQAGENALVVTPTASGKSLCYNLPVLQRILEKPEARALYLFPTKALSQDQQSELNEITLGAELGVKIATYDGDTPTSVRASARETGQIIVSNPDMLHSGVLPNHTKWVKFWKNLHFVVIDEVHSYRGVFGSHVANVIRRLRRVANFYGSTPQFILCSATIGNPAELAQSLIGLPLTLVDKSGAPRGKRHLVLYNPPLVDPVQGIRRGTVNESQAIAVKALRAGIKTIVFARSRVRVELIATYMREKLSNIFNDNEGIRVESYRGGYLPNERRLIEKGLREGTIQGVVSTNALELGIDIGGLDCAILAGFPGSLASVWQQSGRAGRRQGESISILVASSAPLDQYLVSNTGYLIERSPESAFVDPQNPWILREHLKCAAFELPFKPDDPYFPMAEPFLETLTEDGVLRETGGRYYWASQAYPSENISLRSASSENIVIIDVTKGRNEVVGEMDRPSAKELIYPQAVYLHRGRQFHVLELDLEHKRCYIEERTLNFYTDAIVKRDLHVLYEDEEHEVAGVRAVIGDVLVRSQVSKFKKLKFHTHENIGYGEVSLPEEEMHTRCISLVFAEGCAARRAFDALPSVVQGPVMARFGALVKSVAPAFLLCQSADFGVAERLRDPHFDQPCCHFFDSYPGGSGLAEAFARQLPLILSAAKSLVEKCGCAEGCPSCVGPRGSDEIGDDPKAAMTVFLSSWIE